GTATPALELDPGPTKLFGQFAAVLHLHLRKGVLPAPRAARLGPQFPVQPARPGLLEAPAEHRTLVDVEVRRHARFDGILTEEMRAEAVDGPDLRLLEVRDRPLPAQALPHLVRGFFGKRQGQDALDRHLL